MKTYPFFDDCGDIFDILGILGKFLCFGLINLGDALGIDQLDGALDITLGRAEI